MWGRLKDGCQGCCFTAHLVVVFIVILIVEFVLEIVDVIIEGIQKCRR